MAYRLESAQSFSSDDASEADIHRVFDHDHIRGEYVILTAGDGSFIQAAGEGDGPYVLEYRDARTQEHIRAQGEFTKDDVRAAFLQYRGGDKSWRTSREWAPIKSSGCFSIIGLATVLGMLIWWQGG